MSKYKSVSFSIRWEKNSIITFFTQYEDYVIKYQKGGSPNWPKGAEIKYEYLFERLVKPWKIIKHKGRIFSIKDPKGAFWFRALDLSELFKALDICYDKSKKSGAKVKPWKLSLKWAECVAYYKKKRNKGYSWVKKDYDVALLIADNIISTWNTKTGDWKPWNNKWCKLAHKNLTGLKYNLAGVSRKVKNKTEFKDIVNWVFQNGLTGIKRAAFILATAFAVGGTRAAKIINGFHNQYGIRKWWEKR
jgi:hypothetical protein